MQTLRQLRSLIEHAMLRALRTSQGGAVSAEYLMVVGIVGLSLAVTLFALGPDMVLSWGYSRRVLYGRAP